MSGFNTLLFFRSYRRLFHIQEPLPLSSTQERAEARSPRLGTCSSTCVFQLLPTSNEVGDVNIMNQSSLLFGRQSPREHPSQHISTFILIEGEWPSQSFIFHKVFNLSHSCSPHLCDFFAFPAPLLSAEFPSHFSLGPTSSSFSSCPFFTGVP